MSVLSFMIFNYACIRGKTKCQNNAKWMFSNEDQAMLNAPPPLEMCAVGGLVRRGARSNVWRVTTFPLCLL